MGEDARSVPGQFRVAASPPLQGEGAGKGPYRLADHLVVKVLISFSTYTPTFRKDSMQ